MVTGNRKFGVTEIFEYASVKNFGTQVVYYSSSIRVSSVWSSNGAALVGAQQRLTVQDTKLHL